MAAISGWMDPARLGAPPAEVVARLEAIDKVELLHQMIDRYDEQFESWEQLFLPNSTA